MASNEAGVGSSEIGSNDKLVALGLDACLGLEPPDEEDPLCDL